MTEREQIDCPVCDGSGEIDTGRRGPLDPDTITIRCPRCGGDRWVWRDEEEDED